MPHQAPRPRFILLLAIMFYMQVAIVSVMGIVYLGGNPGTTITIGGEPSLLGDHRGEILLSIVVWCPIAYVVASGLWNRKAWARHGIASIFFLVFLASALPGLSERDALVVFLAVLCTLLGWWYFYRKESVRRYFKPWRRTASDRQLDDAARDELDRILPEQVKDT